MPASFHSRRGSAHHIQQPPSLPFHRSTKFYKSSNNNSSNSSNSKTKASLYHQQQQQRRRRKRLWLFFIILLTITIFGGRHLMSFSSSSSSPPVDLMDFPELAIAAHYQLTPVTASTIPKIVHFVYGLKAPDPTLDLIHYLAIKSAHDRLQPDTIMFHYHYLPTGTLFEKARPWLTLHKVDLVPTVFDRPVTHFAHQADIIRLAMLQQYGGIYLDLDVISMAPMDHLLDHEFVMGQEGIDGSVGLCNAVILAKPNARFLQRWQATYKTFDQSDWNYHSVVLPGKLASTRLFDKDNELTILNHTAFFWPLWDSPGLRTLFLEKSYDFSTNYASHIWESAANPHLMAGLSENLIRHIDNSLYCQLRLLLDDDQQGGVRPCRRLDHSPLPDQLVGHWPLTKPPDQVLLDINPTPATDVSGNDMHGIIRNGYFGDNENDGVYVSGQDSYVFLSMPNKMTAAQTMTVQWQMKSKDDKQGGVAMMIQMDTCKVMVKTTQSNGLGVEWWQLSKNGWEWELVQRVDGAQSFGFSGDDAYHRFTLVLGGGGGQESSLLSSSSLLVPNLVLYMDGMVVASLPHWTPAVIESASAGTTTTVDEMVVRGIWFGSAEPAKYQDVWDARPSLAAWYKDLWVWERQLTIDMIRSGDHKIGHVVAAAVDDQQPKDWHVADNDLPVTYDDDNNDNNMAWKDDGNDDELD